MWGFEYPLTRPYPWRFTTAIIVFTSLVVLILLVLVNLVTVGVASYIRYSPMYETPRLPSWVQRLNNPRSMKNFTLGCEPATLMTGGMYQTSNGAYMYTIHSLYNTTAGTPTSNADYDSSDLSNCIVDFITLAAHYATYETQLEVTINCTLADSIELVATTSSVIRPSASEESARTTPVAQNISSLVNAFNDDFYNDVFSARYARRPDTGDPLTAIYVTLHTDANATVTWGRGSFTAAGWWLRDPKPSDVPYYLSPSSLTMIENYIHIYSGAILSDLGVTSKQNPMTSVEAFTSMIKPLNWTWRQNDTPNTNTLLQSNLTSYSSFFSSLRPTQFEAYYLCRYLSWKPTPTLIVDVLVATVSMFMIYWGILAVVLKFFAEKLLAKVEHQKVRKNDPEHDSDV